MANIIDLFIYQETFFLQSVCRWCRQLVSKFLLSNVNQSNNLENLINSRFTFYGV